LPGGENENCNVRQQQQPYEFGKETPGTVETRDGSDILDPDPTLKKSGGLTATVQKAKNSLSLTFQFRESVSARKKRWLAEIFKIPS
jgi:hypothetical protein